ncbi:hypothetical protein [Brevundimonas sp. Root1279]|uniref:hypothetical protein n=1 Tax=Brevundimonas sp. Root1279 TaxID=1736443 RepID=UPI0006F9A3D7|nr:hypothetical protein [Brevundimonas sp. Root1279]KQW83137.1 hypothetical protein ASC65_07345 [Brevundimonas sp. Root1279]
MATLNLTGWIPGRIFWNDADVEASTVEWLHSDEPDFPDAFLDDTFARLRQRPANVLFTRTTTLADLEAWAEASPGISPTGFVFHVSRCGSTLLAALLGRLPGALVLSEPGPVDSVVRAGSRLDRARRVRLLRAMISALGQARAPGQDRLFVKFDAWNTLQLPLIREAFTDTPWVFLRREPVEVLVSALARRGVHVSPGMLPADLFGLTETDLADADAYAAKVLGTIYRAGEAHQALGGGLVLDYRDLPEAAWSTVAAHFGVTPDPETIEAMKALSGDDPKRSGQPFQPDAAAKRAAASAEVQALADRWMRPAYSAPSPA